MADKKLPGSPAAHLPSALHNGKVGGAVPRSSPALHQNGGHHSDTSPMPHPEPSSRTVGSTTSFRSLRTLGDVVSPVVGCSSITPHTHSHGLSSKTRTTATRTKHRSSQQEEPEALLDLILESQGQRMDDQRASISLLPDPGPAALCGACSPEQPHLPSLDFYHMLIHYQSDRMEDQRCPLPDLDDVVGSVPEGQEDFFSLIQRVQSRRMDEQRASLMMMYSEDDDDDDDDDALPNGSAPHHRC